MNVFDSDSIVLRNKREKDDTISFTLWSAAQINREKLSFIIPNIYKLDYNHETSAGYWIYLNVPKKDFEKIINQIKETFSGKIACDNL
ncbi:MAG: hypothetical protein WCW04_02650 [Candidatus Paceibacterota bacterium]